MIISEAIKKLEELRTKHGDVELHLEVGKDQECKHCGEFKYKSFFNGNDHTLFSRQKEHGVLYQ